MKLKQITIRNFRSIENIIVSPSELNIFVGQNNHGKTNFFEAIEWFYKGVGDLSAICFLHDLEHKSVEVDVVFENAQEGIDRMLNEKKKETLQKFLGEKDTIRIRRNSSQPKKRSLYNEEKNVWKENPVGFDNALNDLLPTLEYIRTEDTLKDVSSYKRGTPISQMLSGVMSAILSENKQYQKFQEEFDALFTDKNSEISKQLINLSKKVKGHLQKQFPDCTEVSFAIGQPSFDDLLKNFDTEVNDGVMTRAEEKGDGMQRALMLAILQTYCEFRREKKESAKDFIFLIDEGELHLHPSAQRKLKLALSEISQNGDQVLINTHSPVLIAEHEQHQKLFKVEKANKITDIVEVEDTDKKYVVYDMLGGQPIDLLLPSNFIVVEGRSDYEFIKIIISRFYPEYKYIQTLFAGGDIQRQESTLIALHDTYKTLYTNTVYKDTVIVLCDKPSTIKKQNLYNRFVSEYGFVEDDKLYTLPETDIEMVYPAPYKKEKSELGNDFKKVDYAREVATEITKEDFENSMPKVANALLKAFEKSHK